MIIKKIYKIKDSAMFEGGLPNKSHWYIKYNCHKGAFYKQITHLYYKDPKRFKQLSEGLLVKRRVSSFETPQGVYKKKYCPNKFNRGDIVGKRIVLIKK